jgi:alkylated DNA repair protein (DNA oxidative demethylase)
MTRAQPHLEHERSGHYYFPGYLRPSARRAIEAWLQGLHPIWEYRYPTDRPLPEGREQRRLLRPVYWLGSWQFACLHYYRPPKALRDRCVAAEAFPPVLAGIVADIEATIRQKFPRSQIPPGYALNTCLVNFYGSREEQGRWVDSARVGEHRDFEPGPVASLSIGERALFQFVTSRAGEREAPILSQWLDDGSLQIFGGPKLKDRALHRVQRVDRREGVELPPNIEGFRTRRINFTFRYVPAAHVVPFERLNPRAQSAVRGYVEELARHSEFFAAALARAPRATSAAPMPATSRSPLPTAQPNHAAHTAPAHRGAAHRDQPSRRTRTRSPHTNDRDRSTRDEGNGANRKG